MCKLFFVIFREGTLSVHYPTRAIFVVCKTQVYHKSLRVAAVTDLVLVNLIGTFRLRFRTLLTDLI